MIVLGKSEVSLQCLQSPVDFPYHSIDRGIAVSGWWHWAPILGMIFLEGSVDQPPAKFHCLAQDFDQVCGAWPLIPTEELLSVSFGWRVLYELNACHASKAHCRDLRDSVKHLPKPGMMFLSFLFLDVLTFRTTPNLIPALIHGLLLQMVLWNHFLSRPRKMPL